MSSRKQAINESMNRQRSALIQSFGVERHLGQNILLPPSSKSGGNGDFRLPARVRAFSIIGDVNAVDTDCLVGNMKGDVDDDDDDNKVGDVLGSTMGKVEERSAFIAFADINWSASGIRRASTALSDAAEAPESDDIRFTVTDDSFDVCDEDDGDGDGVGDAIPLEDNFSIPIEKKSN